MKFIAFAREYYIQRFWSFVNKPLTGCWLWTGSKKDGRYGQMWFDGKRDRAHRISYILAHGSIPKDKPHICHSCDNPLCVNPEHLFASTHPGNMRDMRDKFRAKHGKEHYMAKLNKELVIELRFLKRTGMSTFKGMARELSMSPSVISRAVRGITWRHVP